MIRFAFITDFHLQDNTQAVLREVNPYTRLKLVFQALSKQALDFVICGGDLVHDIHRPDTYSTLKYLLTWINTPCHIILGNHDHVGYFLQVFPDFKPHFYTDKVYYFRDFNGFRFVFLDTHVTGANYGLLGEAQLAWLNGILSHSPYPVVLSLHHPVVPTGIDWLDQNYPLQDAAALWNIIQFSPVQLVLFGHLHATLDQVQQRIRLLGTPSTCFQFAPAPQPIPNQGAYRLVELSSSGIHTEVHFVV